MNALIGHTGFVGSNLMEQYRFDAFFNSKNIQDIRRRRFETVVCAGVQAKKWWANQHPEEDWAGIEKLLNALADMETSTFILISTVDVYARPVRVTESTPITPENHAYGKNRYAVEQFITAHFGDHLILRLPGLFGRGLKKNVIYDLLNNNCLDQINPASEYQYYCLDHLWQDIQRSLRHGIRLLNVATEPVKTQDIIDRYFPNQKDRVGQPKSFTATYDMRSEHAHLWRPDAGDYLYDAETVLGEIGQFVSQPQN